MKGYKRMRFEEIDPQIHGVTREFLRKRRKTEDIIDTIKEAFAPDDKNQHTFRMELMLLRYQLHRGFPHIMQLFFTDFTRNRKGGAMGIKNPQFYINNKYYQYREGEAFPDDRIRLDDDYVITGSIAESLFNRMLNSIARKLKYNGGTGAGTRASNDAFVEIPENQLFDDIGADGRRYRDMLTFQQYVRRQMELSRGYNFQIMMSVTVSNIREYRGVLEMDIVDYTLIDESDVLQNYRGWRDYRPAAGAANNAVLSIAGTEAANGSSDSDSNSDSNSHANRSRNRNGNRTGSSSASAAAGLTRGRDLAVDMNKRQYHTIRQLKQLQRSGKLKAGSSYWVIAKMADFRPLKNMAYKTSRYGPVKLRDVSVLLVDISVKNSGKELAVSPVKDESCVEAVVAASPEEVLRFWVASEIEEVYWQQEKMARYVVREIGRINEWEVRVDSTHRWALLTTLEHILHKYS